MLNRCLLNEVKNLMLSRESQSQQGRTYVQAVTGQDELGRGSWVSREGFPEEVAVKKGLEE